MTLTMPACFQDRCCSTAPSLTSYLAGALPTVVAKLGVALVRGQETASEVVVRMEHRAKADEAHRPDHCPHHVLAEWCVHLADELRHVVVVLQIVPEPRMGARYDTASQRERQGLLHRCAVGEHAAS